MPVTLKDIAAMVGVSTNTVCRALKDKPDIGVQTRQRVKDAAAALGYRPNLNARSLVLRKSSTIGVAVTESDNPVRMEFCEKLRSLAEIDGYRLLTVGLSLENEEHSLASIEDLLSRGIDGLIVGWQSGILAEQPIGRILQDCKNNNIPVTVFGAPNTGLADCVYIDFEECAYRLTSHILKQGLSPVAFMHELPPEKRYLGYLRAMAEYGKKDDALLWNITGHRLSSGKEAMERYLAEFKKPPQAVIAANDMVAIGVMSALKMNGWSIPQDVAVAGFDNIEIDAYLDPALTSIGLDNGVFAETIWKLINTRLKSTENGEATTITLHPEMVIRKSCQ